MEIQVNYFKNKKAQEKHNIPSAARVGLAQFWVLKFIQLEQLDSFVKDFLNV